MMVPFLPGHCANCGKQAMVRNGRGQPILPMAGTKLCYLVLGSQDRLLETRIGTFPICAECDVDDIDPKQIKDNLVSENSPSGIDGSEAEWAVLPNMRLEVVKTFGE